MENKVRRDTFGTEIKVGSTVMFPYSNTELGIGIVTRLAPKMVSIKPEYLFGRYTKGRVIKKSHSAIISKYAAELVVMDVYNEFNNGLAYAAMNAQ